MARPHPALIVSLALMGTAIAMAILALAFAAPFTSSTATRSFATTTTIASSGSPTLWGQTAVAQNATMLAMLADTPTPSPVPTRRPTATYPPCPTRPAEGATCWHPAATGTSSPTRPPLTPTALPGCEGVSAHYEGFCVASGSPTPNGISETRGTGGGSMDGGEGRIGDNP